MTTPTHLGLTIKEVSEILGVHRSTVERMVRTGQIKRYKIGAAARYNRHEILALVGADCEPHNG